MMIYRASEAREENFGTYVGNIIAHCTHIVRFPGQGGSQLSPPAPPPPPVKPLLLMYVYTQTTMC